MTSRLFSSEPHIVVDATAGSGKTFTIKEGVRRIKGEWRKGVKGSDQQEAIWEEMQRGGAPDRIRLMTFSSAGADQLKADLPEGVEASSTYGYGFALAKKQGKGKMFDNLKYYRLLQDILGMNQFELHRKHPGLSKCCVELCDKARFNLKREVTDQDIDDYCDYYGIDVPEGREALVESSVNLLLEEGRKKTQVFDHTDMVYLPNVLGMVRREIGLVIVDEYQDQNEAQWQLAINCGHRVMLVGDANQSIYAFNGVDVEACPRMAAWLKMSKRGVREMPLTLSRRCSKAVVAEAQKLVPRIQAMENACEGLVTNESQLSFNLSKLVAYDNMKSKAQFAKGLRGAVGTEASGDRTGSMFLRKASLLNLATGMAKNQRHTMIVCPTNAPLVSLYLAIKKMKGDCFIEGKKIGEDLVRLCEGDKIIEVQRKLNQKLDKLGHRKPSSATVAQMDMAETALEISQGCKTTDELKIKVKEMFKDGQKTGIKLSSVHKAKGDEADRVVFWRWNTCYSQFSTKEWEHQQDRNVHYVGETRAAIELNMVRS